MMRTRGVVRAVMRGRGGPVGSGMVRRGVVHRVVDQVVCPYNGGDED